VVPQRHATPAVTDLGYVYVNLQHRFFTIHSAIKTVTEDIMQTGPIMYPLKLNGSFYGYRPLEPSLYSNDFRDIQRRVTHWLTHDLDTTSKQRSRSFVLV